MDFGTKMKLESWVRFGAGEVEKKGQILRGFGGRRVVLSWSPSSSVSWKLGSAGARFRNADI